MNFLDYHLNKEIFLEVVNDAGEIVGPIYTSKITEVFDNENLSISTPLLEQFPIPFPTGTRIKMIFIGNNNEKHCLYGKVLDKSSGKNIISLESKLYSQYDNSQKRLFYRVDCRIEIEYRVIISDPDEINPSRMDTFSRFHKAFTRNISSSGFCMVTDENVSLNNLIESILHIDSSEIVTLSQIMRKVEIFENSKVKYELGLRFLNLSDKDEDRVTKFIFQKEREFLSLNNKML